MQAIVRFATNHPLSYLAICFTLGTIVRAAMAHDIGQFFDPLFPLFRR